MYILFSLLVLLV